MPDVRLPDGRVARFPDDMPREQIKGIIAEKFPEASSASPAPAMGGGTAPSISPQQFDERFKGTAQGGPLDAAMQGMSFGFSDELLGNAAGLYALMRGRGFDTAGKVRDAFTNDQRNRLNEYRERKPVEAIGWEIGGALPTALVPMGGLGRAAQGGNLLKATGAAVGEGAILGGLYGAGTADGDLAARARGAGTGAVVGGATGGLAQPITRGLAAGAERFAAPIRGLFNTDREAAKRVAAARLMDDRSARPGISRADEALAMQNGQVITNLDRGGAATRNLARASSNISGEAEASLEAAIVPRYEAQSQRVTDAVQRIVGGKGRETNREALQGLARRQNAPAYRRAFARPEAQGLWDDTLAQMAGDPDVVAAMRRAGVTARSDAAKNGFDPIRNPFIEDATTGRLRPKEGVLPNLQYWDAVKRELDRVKTPNSMQWAKVLRTHLDELVPGYSEARAGAAKFFGQESALDAGYDFLGSTMRNEEARRGLTKMTSTERQLFGEGFADALINKAREAGFNRDVTINSMFNSPAARERLTLALGPKRAKEIEAVVRIESILDKARKAMGNSTSAKQFAAMALATGGTGGYGFTTGDWRPMAGLLTAAVAKKGLNAIDVKVMTSVAEKLASRDPKVVQEGIRAAASDERILNTLRQLTAAGTISQAVPAFSPQ